MAEKRMFSKKIIDTDCFMEMPASTQNLYFHLSMRADDDGFVASPKRIVRLVGASEDDFRLLITKRYIIPFESGVCVITDWRINNYLRSDRYTETSYKEEKRRLTLDENGRYQLGIPQGIPTGIPVVSTDIYSLSSNTNTISNIEDRGVGKEEKTIVSKAEYGEFHHVYLSDSELSKLKNDYGEEKSEQAISYLDKYIEMTGKDYKNHYLALRKWVFNALDEDKIKRKELDKREKSLRGDKIKGHEYTDEECRSVIIPIDEVTI